MNKSLTISLVFLVFLCCCVTMKKEVTKNKSIVTVAVWDFEDISPYPRQQYAYLKTFLADSAIQELQGFPDIKPVERSRLLEVLQEQSLGSGELVDESTRLHLGKLLGAKWMLFGSYQIFGNQARFDVRLVDVETSKVLGAEQRVIEKLDPDKCSNTVKKLTAEVVSR